MAYKMTSMLLATALLSCYAIASARDLQNLQPADTVYSSDLKLASFTPDQINSYHTLNNTLSKTCLTDHSMSVAAVWSSDSWVQQAQPGRTFTTCQELCPVVDMFDSIQKSSTSGSTVFYGQGWTAMDIGNGPSGTVPTDSMFHSLKVNKVFGSCGTIAEGGPNGTYLTYFGTEASVTLVSNGTVFQSCIFVDTTGSARWAPTMSGAPFFCQCQRMCLPTNKLCNQQVWWGGRSCGSCQSDVSKTYEMYGVSDAGCGCRVNRWEAYWAGWYGKDDGKCYSNVLTPNGPEGLLPPTDFMKEPKCASSIC